MIYKKDAKFSYPVLTNASTGYLNNTFILDVSFNELADDYRFEILYEIGSPYINNLIVNGDAVLIFIIQTKDNYFSRLSPNQKIVDISKKRLSLTGRTSIQIFIQSAAEIHFGNNNDVIPFYDEFKEQLTIPKNSLLGFSNIVTFDGNIKKPLELFEQKLDENLLSDLKIELGSETIIIHFRKPEFQFNGSSNKAFNNPYIYTGLYTALMRFIDEYRESDDDYVDLSNVLPPENPLDFKLYELMRSKMVDEVSKDSIDEVISKITDRIIEKYAYAAKGQLNNED